MSIQYRRLRRLSVFAAVALAAIFAAFAAQSSDLGERFSETIPCGVACDNAYTLFIGGDLLLAPDGQIEGRAAISGTLQLTGTGAFTSSVGGIGAAATGFNRSAEDLGENLVVAGDVIIDTGHALRVDGVTPISGTVVVGGQVTGTLLADNAGVAGNQYISPTLFSDQFDELRGASQCWKSVPSNGTFDNSGADLLFTGDGVSVLQVFEVTGIPTSGSIVFANIPTTATILVNVFGDVDYSGPGISNTEFVSMTVFNFYDAANINLTNIDPASAWRGSILAVNPGVVVTTSLALEGRILVEGDLIQGRNSVEFRSVPFSGRAPNCDWGDLPDRGIGTGPDNYVTLSRGPGVSTLIGPSHILTEDVYLGNCVDSEPVGQPSNGPPWTPALKDDMFPPHGASPHFPDTIGTCGESGGIDDNDEDGVTEGPGSGGGGWQNGVGGGSINVVGSSGACFNGWIDWNNNGLFTDTDEQVATNVTTIGVSQNITFTIPADTITGGTQSFFARYRLTANCKDYANGSAAPTDVAFSGEVEDYQHTRQHPTAATVADAAAAVAGEAVTVQWVTADERTLAGFNILAAATGQPARQVNAALIAAQAGGSVEGASYTWRDPAPLAAGETRLYWLEEVELTGNTTQHGPLTVANVAHRLFLPGVFRR
jgi:choice-of-anchor A domain-containing protein